MTQVSTRFRVFTAQPERKFLYSKCYMFQFMFDFDLEELELSRSTSPRVGEQLQATVPIGAS
jgi:hypothetical protein